ncbi:FadD3 family acyl-CoA ligase [Streptomyces oceani]|uniref:Fatty acid--CoA ligase n=1 Tax=Streptomyces oceani TaxID=1075402 RepID=A0A1E7KKM4_9ACTN|nr:FadD3 family acyl-CoA ligase [Streptomyces oceani]OEV04549.1 fatty acid--CoA ligase [Streptomyces oceani]
MPPEETTIPGALTLAATAAPDVEAVVDGELRLSYRQLRDEALAVTRSLLARGTARGDRIALWAPNSTRWITAALGVLSAGAVLVPVNTRYKGEEARDVLRRSGARLLFVEDGFLGNDYLALLGVQGESDRTAPDRPVPDLTDLAEVVTLDQGQRAGATSWESFLRDGDRVPTDEAVARAVSVRADDVSDVLFTSGTTGRPKGVLTTHGQNVRTYRAWCDRTGLVRGDRYLIINPMFHSFGYKAGVLACLLRGATMVLQLVFDVAETMRLVQTESVTVLPGPPTIYTSLLDAPGREDYDLSSLRLAVTGAATVPVALVRRIRAELFPTVLTAYGLTESCGTVSACTARDPDEAVARTAGRPIEGVRVRVVDAQGEGLPAGRDGVVLVRGHNVMRGYLDDPEATAEAVDPEGWLDTGDIGHLDEDGRLTLTGRSKEMFVVGGFNVSPAEVEQTLARHDAVAEAAVIGVPDHRMGEIGHAYVTLRPGAVTTPTELVDHCRELLANFKAPREVTVLETLPRNAAGKIRKDDLRGTSR